MLNSNQKIAVECTEGALLILAGAGAGKTHTLTERVAYMINTLGIAPGSILCVTFTNKAAKEMKERVGKVLGRETDKINPYRSFDFPLVGTFHSIGVYFLRLFIDKLGYDKSFSILDEDDKMKIIKEILEEKGIDPKEFGARPIAYAIGAAKNNGHNAKIFNFNTKSYFEEKVSEVYAVYEQRLMSMNCLDFDDILIRTNELMDIPEVLEYFQKRFSYFMVDEYQDTNEMQYKIMKKLASLSCNICVVGDDWQGIYSWRGANIQNIFNFQKDYKNCNLVKLEQNYRSTKTIIEAANAVIKCNDKIMDKTLWTDNIEGEKVTLIETQDEKHEAEIIAQEIRKIQDDTPDQNVAILYRTNGQSRLIEEALLMKGISYRVFGGVKFYERKEIKDILAYLRLLSNPFDVMSFKRVINTPSRKIGAKSVETLLSYSGNYKISPLEIIENAQDIEELTPLARKGSLVFKNIFDDLKSHMSDMSLEEILWKVVQNIDYEAYLLEEYGSEEYEAKLDNLKEFKNMAARYNGIDTTESLQMFLEEIALITDADRNDESNAKVGLMTIHLSKGLEFDNVFIAGAEEGIFPHSRSLQEPKELEEERRLMYVAMTRAKKKLFISRAKERFYFGSFSANPRSRFIREIPKELTDEMVLMKNNYGSFLGGSTGSTSSFSFANLGTSAPAKKTLTLNDPNIFGLGDKVNHAKFGVGTIVSISGSMADIAFTGGVGIKKMNIEIAPLQKI